MRIAVLADASLPHTQRWVEALTRRGHECLVVSLESGTGYAAPTEWVAVGPKLPRFVRYTLAIARVRKLLKAFRPDVVNPHFLPNYGWMAVHIGLRPIVLSVLGSDLLTVPQKGPLHAWRTRFVLARSDFVLSDAEMLTDAACRFGFPRERVRTVPWGIELHRFPWPPSHLELPETTCVVLSTRRLDPVYDVGTLLIAAKQMKPTERRHFAFRIAGSGPDETRLRQQAQDLDVTFLGWLSQVELANELQAAHLYVSTSKSDSTSVSLLEAMAAGCFPVVSDIAGNREWVKDGVGGLLFPAGDANALADALRRAQQDIALRSQAALHNRRLVETRATWDVTITTAEQLFEQARAGTVHHL